MITGIRIARMAMPAVLGLALLSGAAWAQQPADQNRDEHHAPGQQQAQPATPAPSPLQGAPQRRGPGGPGMGMRGGGQGMPMPEGDMRRMMQMMQGMMMGGMGGPGPGAMRAFERIEGQLAFFRTELRITDAQMPQWNAFAEVIRTQAGRLRQVMTQAMGAAGQPATAPQLLERHAAALTAQLEATRAVSAALGPLYASLSDEQKRAADELMAEHLRSMRMRGM